MTIDLAKIIPIAAIIAYATIYILVALSKPQNSVKRRFRLYLLTMWTWSVGAYLVLIGFGDTTFWFRFMSSAAIATMLGLFYFTQGMVNEPIRGWSQVIYIFGFIAILVNLLTPIVTPYAALVDGVLVYELTLWIYLLAAPGYLVVMFSMFQLYQSSRASRDETVKTRYFLLITAVVVVLIGAAFNFTDLGKYPVDIAANVIAAFIITYAILRHQLLDIRVVIRKSVLYFIPTVIIGAAYFLALSIALLLVNTETQRELILIALLVSLLGGLFILPLRDRLQRWVDRFFFRERYNEVMMLQRVTQTAASVIDIDQLAIFIMEEITETLHVEKAALFLQK